MGIFKAINQVITSVTDVTTRALKTVENIVQAAEITSEGYLDEVKEENQQKLLQLKSKTSNLKSINK